MPGLQVEEVGQSDFGMLKIKREIKGIKIDIRKSLKSESTLMTLAPNLTG
jgi:hypothetical protein